MMANNRMNEDSVNDQPNFALRSVRVRGEVHMPMVVWHIEQKYANSGDDALEVVYTFPTPNGAVVRNVVIDWAGQTLTGVVKSKTQAQDNYDDAIENGDSAVLIECNHFGIYTANLGNLAPGETCRVQFQAVQLLNVVGDRADLRLPTVIGMRYGDAQHKGGIAQNALPHSRWDVSYPLEISIELHREAASFMAFSPSHRMDMSGSNPRIYTLKGKAFLDRDFELQLSGIPLTPTGLIARDPTSDSESYVSISSFVRPLPEPDLQPSNALRLKVLVDCSGSMAGGRIESAKRALAELLDSLREVDEIFLSRFGNSVEHLSAKPLQKNEKSNKKMMNWLSALNADMGGTEMQTALQSVFNLGESQSDNQGTAVTDVLLITDGEIWAGNELIRAALQTNTRVFVIGVGLSPNANFLEVLARASGGSIAYLSNDEDLDDSVKHILQRLQSPQVQSISLLADGAAIPSDALGELMPWGGVPFSLYGNESLHAFVIHSTPVEKTCLQGVESGSDSRVSLDANLSWVNDPQLAETLASLVVNARLVSLEHALMLAGEDTEAESLKQKIGLWAERYGLMSSQTSFVMVHERADKQASIPVLQNSPQMIVAGICELRSVELFSTSRDLSNASYNEPTVWRNVRSEPPLKTTHTLQMIVPRDRDIFVEETYEIPDFLKPEILPRRLEELAREWAGLLDETRESCFTDLISCGLEPNEIEALETVLKHRMAEDAGVTEREVCTVFILLLKSISSELQSSGPVEQLWQSVKQWAGGKQSSYQKRTLPDSGMLRAQQQLPLELEETTLELVRVWGAKSR